MHQLIILGNGFDLACGLKSKFSQFFDNRTNGTFLCNKKSRSTSGFSYFGMKKATVLCGRSPLLIVVKLA